MTVNKEYTYILNIFPNVITFVNRYRPPDVLFGAKLYTTSIDMWSAGCIFAGWFAVTQNYYKNSSENGTDDAYRLLIDDFEIVMSPQQISKTI